MKEAMDRFQSLDLHDSKLLGVAVKRVPGAEDDVVLTVRLLGGRAPDITWTDAELVFRDCMYFACDLNLVDKMSCSDSIFENSCKTTRAVDSDAVLQERIDFTIGLCPPGGDLRIIARDFAVHRAPPN